MGRKQTTIRLTESLLEEIDEEADGRDLSRSEYIREILQERHRADELADTVDDLRSQLEDREQRISDLEQQLSRRSQVERKVEELPDKIREAESEPDPPFFVSWYRWFRER
jgi:predicted DNA binding CopG/RHH family protein